MLRYPIKRPRRERVDGAAAFVQRSDSSRVQNFIGAIVAVARSHRDADNSGGAASQENFAGPQQNARH